MGSVVLDSDRPVTCTLNGSPLPLGDSKHPSCLLLFYISHSYALHSKLGLSCTDRLQDVDIKETINKEVKTKERWAEWSWIVTGPNGWEDFESLTRPVTCTPNGSPLPLGDSKHSSCLLLFYISHSYALHSKLGLSCTDRLVFLSDVSGTQEVISVHHQTKTKKKALPTFFRASQDGYS
ncbi:hypothetical protein IGI04_036688 [Brassica rapa subsp. trilocularis]|uniref:Uncharacterized protein n=1 Tax=Brassica rapa subsp. trilocularis TaxID=1813537 RepID=A0ABQ7LF68_BRACM|nr:hypothetical protein IGI04_036688 [Brassica rapa subsp. trilocularis]